MKLKNVKKYLLVLIIFHFKYAFVRTDIEKGIKLPGWFSKRNYTTYCHGGKYDNGLIPITSGHMGVVIYIDNETRCTLKKRGFRVDQYYGIEPPDIILPGDCGVFWGASEKFSGLMGWNHYMCEEYGVLIALEFVIPRHSSNKYGLWARGFGNAEHVLRISYDAPSKGNVVSFNVFISEKKRFCPCTEKKELVSNKYKYDF